MENWKSMSSRSSMLAAIRAEECAQLIQASKALLETLPLHWHDEATVNLRDLISDIESRANRLAEKE